MRNVNVLDETASEKTPFATICAEIVWKHQLAIGERDARTERERETETETERQSPKALRALEILLISMSTTQTVEEKRRRKKKHQKTTTFGLTFPTTLWPPEYQLVGVLSPVNASSRRLGHGN